VLIIAIAFVIRQQYDDGVFGLLSYSMLFLIVVILDRHRKLSFTAALVALSFILNNLIATVFYALAYKAFWNEKDKIDNFEFVIETSMLLVFLNICAVNINFTVTKLSNAEESLWNGASRM